MRAGDEITVAPAELVAGGAALAKIDGFPIFVTNVYPGDVAVVRLLEVKKGFARADLVRLVEPSPFRRAMPCPVANECGGCDWTALRLDKQLEAKKRILTESLRRVGKIDPATLPPITVHPSPLNYRLRSRLHSDGDKVGFFAMRTNEVVQLPAECEVVGVETARIWSAKGVIPRVARDPGEGRRPNQNSCDRRPGPSPVRSVGMTPDALQIWEVDGKLITDGEFTIDGYHVTTDVFFQVNRHLLGTIRRLVSEIAARSTQKQTAVDLYSGVGFFSRPLAEVFENVTASRRSGGGARMRETQRAGERDPRERAGGVVGGADAAR